jgi:hypothetical protein
MHKIVNKPLFSKECLENCDFQGKSLLNINNFRGIINLMRAYKDATTSYVALFCCMGLVVCVFIIQNTRALKHATTIAQKNMAARAKNCFSLFLVEACYE